jgi:hypothetical protein
VTNQEKLDAALEKLAGDYQKLSDKQIDFAIKEIARVRGDISDMLADFSDKDGIIKRERLARLLRELDEVETLVRSYGKTAMDAIIKETSAFATTGANAAILGAVGTGALVTASMERLNRDVFEYVVKRFGEDGLVLSDRVWRLSGDIRDELSKVLRADILRGESVGTMIANIRRVQDNETWKIKRLVVTEGNTTYRAATAMNASRSDIVEWVKINESGRRHRHHPSHRCYKLAREDNYGQGAGIFKPSDSQIYMPHPNCSSFITYVIDEEYL